MAAQTSPVPNPGHAASWYAASANDSRVRETLTEALSADICIVGAGFTGISAALELSERGYSVVVVEAERIGFGASGRNGGQIVNGYSRDLDTIEGRYGRDKANALAAMSREGGDIIRARIEKYGIDCDLRHGGFFAAFWQAHSYRQRLGIAETGSRRGHATGTFFHLIAEDR